MEIGNSERCSDSRSAVCVCYAVPRVRAWRLMPFLAVSRWRSWNGMTSLPVRRRRQATQAPEFLHVVFSDAFHCGVFVYLVGTSSRSTKLIHGGVRYLEKAFTKLDK